MVRVITGDRGAFGAAGTAAQASPLRVNGAPARTAGQAVLSLDANADVRTGALDTADIPSAFTRRNVAEPISSSWTWGAGAVVEFASGGVLAPPQISSRSLGTRLIIEPVAGSTEYAFGREAGAVWASVPAGAEYRWYTGNVYRFALAADGTLYLAGGSGAINLQNNSDGSGAVSANANLWLTAGATGSLLLQSGGRAIVPVEAYRENLGAINRKYLTLHCAELWAETLVAQNTMATIGGRILVGPTSTLTRDLTAADTTIYLRHNSVLMADYLMLEAASKFEMMQATSGPTMISSTEYAYTVTRNADGSGATVWYAGDAVFNTGQFGDGFIDLYSIKGARSMTTAGPTIVGNVRTSSAIAGSWEERWAIGNLQGLYGNGSIVYGFAAGSRAGLHIQVDAVNGVRILAGVQTFGSWDMGGNLVIGRADSPNVAINNAGNLLLRRGSVTTMALDASSGNLTLEGNIASGASNFTTGKGYWLGWNAGNPQFRIGTAPAASTPRYFAFDSAANAGAGSVKLVTEGFTIDENGINLQQGAGFVTGRSITWGTPGTGMNMGDSSATNTGRIYRGGGTVELNAASDESIVRLFAGGSGIPRAEVALQALDTTLASFPTLNLSGNAYGGATVLIVKPRTHLAADIGHNTYNFRFGYFNGMGIALGVGVNPSYTLQLGTDSAGKTTSSTWQTTSDRRAKEAITHVDPHGALALVRSVPLYRYVTNGLFGTEAGARGIGVMAEEVQPLMPESVRRRDDGALSFNAHELIMLTTAAVQALAARLETLERGSQ